VSRSLLLQMADDSHQLTFRDALQRSTGTEVFATSRQWRPLPIRTLQYRQPSPEGSMQRIGSAARQPGMQGMSTQAAGEIRERTCSVTALLRTIAPSDAPHDSKCSFTEGDQERQDTRKRDGKSTTGACILQRKVPHGDCCACPALAHATRSHCTCSHTAHAHATR
jgi:hypothetical protein